MKSFTTSIEKLNGQAPHSSVLRTQTAPAGASSELGAYKEAELNLLKVLAVDDSAALQQTLNLHYYGISVRSSPY